jgi:DNA-binding NarL/FixJ family response regulator
MSENLTLIEIDASTGVQVIRELTKEELDERQELASKENAATEAKESARSSALAKLAALGLTEEEIAAL